MVEQSKSVFLQALIVTVIFFIIGLVLGFNLESNRVDKTELILLNSEINLLDEQVRGANIEIFNISCDLATKSTFEFADRIYQEALKLEDYDSSSKFTNELEDIHKKYDLLRMLLWIKSIEIREQCPEQFHTAVYLFDYGNEDITIKARQTSLSRLLSDLKNKYGSQVLLIPISANLNLESVNLILEKYNIDETPVILVDEKKLVKDTVSLEQLEDIIFEKNDFEKLRGSLFEEPNLNRPEKIMLNA